MNHVRCRDVRCLGLGGLGCTFTFSFYCLKEVNEAMLLVIYSLSVLWLPFLLKTHIDPAHLFFLPLSVTTFLQPTLGLFSHSHSSDLSYRETHSATRAPIPFLCYMLLKNQIYLNYICLAPPNTLLVTKWLHGFLLTLYSVPAINIVTDKS